MNGNASVSTVHSLTLDSDNQSLLKFREVPMELNATKHWTQHNSLILKGCKASDSLRFIKCTRQPGNAVGSQLMLYLVSFLLLPEFRKMIAAFFEFRNLSSSTITVWVHLQLHKHKHKPPFHWVYINDFDGLFYHFLWFERLNNITSFQNRSSLSLSASPTLSLSPSLSISLFCFYMH